jgi:large subunit ribosomal protein L32
MPVPKQKKSKSKTRTRRSHNDKVMLTRLVACQHCGEYTRPHRACSNCGFYKDREVVPQEVE